MMEPRPSFRWNALRNAFRLAHPWLLSAFLVLSFYSANMRHLEFCVVLYPLGVTGAACLLLWGSAFLIIRDSDKASLAATLGLVMNFLFPHVFRAAKAHPFFAAGNKWKMFSLVTAWALLYGVCVVRIFWARKRPVWSWGVSLLVSGMLGTAAAQVLAYHMRETLTGPRRAARAFPGKVRAAIGAMSCVSRRDLPHIAYLLVDGYARADVLQDLYNFDNSAFLTALRAKGFFVQERAFANYCQTALAQASTLNLNYLQDVLSGQEQSSDRVVLGDLIANNALIAILTAHGYRVHRYPSGYHLTDRFPGLRLLPASPGGQFSATFFDETFLTTLVNALYRRRVNPAEAHRHRVRATLEYLPLSLRSLDPVFVYAHIVCPHPPFLFRADGSPMPLQRSYTLSDGDHLTGAELSPDAYVAGYVSQLQFLNAQLERLMDAMLCASVRPLVIVLQADHGPGSRLLWEDKERTDLRERLAIFSAFYFPDGDYSALDTVFSSVNTFRVILRQFLGLDIPLLPDRAYFSKWSLPYEFHEVSLHSLLPPSP